MNYVTYIDTLKPESILEYRTENLVKDKIKEKNITIKKRKAACLSAAACFAVIATTVLSEKDLNDKPYIESNTTIISTAPKTDKKITINTNTDSSKYGAQKIIIDNMVYCQYCRSGDKAKWGEDNGNVDISTDDIGELICTLDAKKLIALEQWGNYSVTMTDKEAQSSIFNKAEIYEYRHCKNSTRLLAKANESYYFFDLSDLTVKSSVKDIFDIYTASGNNRVKRIEFIENSPDMENVKKTNSTTDKNEIDKIINALKNCNDNYLLDYIYSKEYAANYKSFSNDYEKYTLVFVFDDDTRLCAGFTKKYFRFDLQQKDNYGYYPLPDDAYSLIKNYFN